MSEFLGASELWAAFIGTFFGAFLLHWMKKYEDWKTRPILFVEVEDREAFRVNRRVTMEQHDGDMYQGSGVWFRVRVVNRGRSVAKGVRVFLTKAYVADSTSFFLEKSEEIPLRWSHLGDERDKNFPLAVDIPSGFAFFADVLCVMQADKYKTRFDQNWLSYSATPSHVDLKIQSPMRMEELEKMIKSASSIRFEITPVHESGVGENLNVKFISGLNLEQFRWLR